MSLSFEKTFSDMISIILVTASERLNEPVRTSCLWHCVTTMHQDPGLPFELILVDNTARECRQHRNAIDEIFGAYETCTHLVRNRVNERFGGGARQGAMLADGEILVFMADDTKYGSGWLRELVRPLTDTEGAYVGSLDKGPSVRGRMIGKITVSGVDYTIFTRAGAYCWAIRRVDYESLPEWRRQHFADTRMANNLVDQSFTFTVPESEERLIGYTNLNFLRPWRYSENLPASETKRKFIENVWKTENIQFRPVDPRIERFPLKNPDKQMRGGYSEEYLKEHASHLTDKERTRYTAYQVGVRAGRNRKK